MVELAAARYQRGIELWGLGRQEEAVQCFESALELDPSIAGLPYEEGLRRAREGAFQEAEGWLWLAHLFRPEHAPTLSCLGDVLRRLGRLEEALPLLTQAVGLAPESWEAHSDLALALSDLDRLQEANESIERAAQLHGWDANLIVNLASVRKSEGRFDEARRLLEEAIRLQPGLAAAHVNRAHLLLFEGRFAEGWPEYERRPQRSVSEERRLESHGWEGKTVLLHQEQGAGDLIQFIRYAALLEGASVIVSCDERFIPLMRRARGIQDAISWNGRFPNVDLEANVMSLAGLFPTDFHTIPVPYLHLDTELIEKWRRRLGGETRRRVGLVWGGNPANPVERRRGIPLVQLAPILSIPDVAFYSLQQGPQRDQLSGVTNIVDLANDCADVMDAAAAMMNLDLILTTDTMPAHLAGALARPVWVMLHFPPDWRWMADREDSPWYPGMRLFRQTQLGQWDTVVEQVVDALKLQ